MTHVAFYAPMKATNNPRPSGDRELARAFVHALRTGGNRVSIAALLRSWEGRGDARRQAAIAARGHTIAEALVRRWRHEPPDLWFTYHLYHKAPDWIGPQVSRALSIPYVVAEASIADKQRDGRWHPGYTASLDAVQNAAAIICLNPGDREALLRYRGAEAIHLLKPFHERPQAVAEVGRHPVPRLIAVGMMRAGDKLESYRQLAEVLQQVADRDWRLTVVGDGEQRNTVEALFREQAERVTFTGRLPPDRVQLALAQHDLCVWPAHNEALGMALLEAQLCGVPVVAGGTSGVATVVEHGVTGLLSEPGDTAGMADAVRQLLGDQLRLQTMAHAAQRRAGAQHSVEAAAQALNRILSGCRTQRH